jgi:hypothetical protein
VIAVYSNVLCLPDVPDSRIAPGVVGTDLGSGIVRAVIGDYEFEVGKGLIEVILDGACEVPLTVVHR